MEAARSFGRPRIRSRIARSSAGTHRGVLALHPGFCNGPELVNPFCVVRSPVTCFCTGSARGRHLMGLIRGTSRPIYGSVIASLDASTSRIADLIHRPGEGTSLREVGVSR